MKLYTLLYNEYTIMSTTKKMQKRKVLFIYLHRYIIFSG